MTKFIKEEEDKYMLEQQDYYDKILDEMIIKIEGGGNLADILSKQSSEDKPDGEQLVSGDDEPDHPVQSWIDKANWRHSRNKDEFNLATSALTVHQDYKD
jgi:hypothetical protein